MRNPNYYLDKEQEFRSRAVKQNQLAAYTAMLDAFSFRKMINRPYNPQQRSSLTTNQQATRKKMNKIAASSRRANRKK